MHAAVDSSLPHAFSAAELARATRTSLAEVQAWIEAGAIRPLPVGDGITWLTRDEALRAGRAVLDGCYILRGVVGIGPSLAPIERVRTRAKSQIRLSPPIL